MSSNFLFLGLIEALAWSSLFELLLRITSIWDCKRFNLSIEVLYCYEIWDEDQNLHLELFFRGRRWGMSMRVFNGAIFLKHLKCYFKFINTNNFIKTKTTTAILNSQLCPYWADFPSIQASWVSPTSMAKFWACKGSRWVSPSLSKPALPSAISP